MNYLNATRYFLTKRKTKSTARNNVIEFPLLLFNFNLLIFNQFNMLIFQYLMILYMYLDYCYSLSITGYRFPLTASILKSIVSYLVCSKPQHKVTSINLWRQFSILLCQMLEVLRQAWNIDNHRCSLLFWSCYPLGTDKTSGKCIFFLQSTPQQNWILLSVFQNRSENLRAAVTTH